MAPSKVARQIQPTVRRQRSDSDSASATSDDGRTTERITARTVVRMKRRIPPKPAPRHGRMKKVAAPVKRAKAAVEQQPNAVPFQQIVVGEREGEPNYRKPGGPSNQGEGRQHGDRGTSREHPLALASGSQQAGPSAGTTHGDVVEEPLFVPEPLPKGAHRPSIARLHEVLSGIDNIGQYDGHIRSEIADIGSLIAHLTQREAEVAQKMRDAYRTRTALEKMYTSRVRLEPWLIGQGKHEREGEEQSEVAEELRRKSLDKGKRRADDSDAAPAEDEEARPSAKRARSH